MSDLSSFQTTSFHTRLSFLDEDDDDSTFENVVDDEDELGDTYESYGPSGNVNNQKRSVL